MAITVCVIANMMHITRVINTNITNYSITGGTLTISTNNITSTPTGKYVQIVHTCLLLMNALYEIK